MALTALEVGSFLHYDWHFSNLRTQTLLYFAQCAHLALKGKPLFDAEFQNWKLGPVVPCLWSAIRYNRLSPAQDLCKDQTSFLTEVTTFFRSHEDCQLVKLSHGSLPRKLTPSNQIISTDMMTTSFPATPTEFRLMDCLLSARGSVLDIPGVRESNGTALSMDDLIAEWFPDPQSQKMREERYKLEIIRGDE